MSFEIKTIGEIFGDVKIGGTPARERAEYFGGGIPWVSIKDMGKGKYVSETNETLSESGVQNSNVKLIKKGALLFSFKLTVGRMCFAGTDLYTNEAIAAFEPNPEIMLEYLYYILPVATKQVKRTNNFGAPLLNKDQIKKLQIPLPPLETQKAIVAKLDQIFAELDQTKSEIQKNLDNTDELWKSALNQAFQGDWEMKKLGDCVNEKDLGLIKSANEQGYNKKFKYVKMNNIGTDGLFIEDNLQRVDLEESEVERYTLNKGDFLFNTRNSFELVGKATVFPHEKDSEDPYLYNNNILRIRFKDYINSYYLNYSWQSQIIKQQLNNIKSGTTNVSAIYYKDLSGINIPVPPLSEQEKIVEHLDQVSKEVKALKSQYQSQYQSQLDNLEELKKSVLDKAFKGEMGE